MGFYNDLIVSSYDARTSDDDYFDRLDVVSSLPPRLSTPVQPTTTTTDGAILAALDRLADEQARSAVSCMAAGDDAGVGDFRRACTAYTNARTYYAAGVRPLLLSDGRIRLQRASGSTHTVTMRPGQMPICSCQAQASMHWPLALVIALEVAGDNLDDWN